MVGSPVMQRVAGSPCTDVPECGDLGCGALTVDLQSTSEGVQWSRGRHEYQEVDRGWRGYDLAEFPELSFDRAGYGEVLDDALRQAGHTLT